VNDSGRSSRIPLAILSLLLALSRRITASAVGKMMASGLKGTNTPNRLSSAVGSLLLVMAVSTCPARMAGWADFQGLSYMIGNPSRRWDIGEAHLGICGNADLSPGIGFGTALFRVIGPTWKTGLSCCGAFPLDVKAVMPLSFPHRGNVLFSLRVNGTAMFWGLSTNKAAGLGSARWYGGAVGLDFSPEFDVGAGFNGGIEFGWLRAQNLLRGQDDAVWHWGIRLGWGAALLKFGD